MDYLCPITSQALRFHVVLMTNLSFMGNTVINPDRDFLSALTVAENLLRVGEFHDSIRILVSRIMNLMLISMEKSAALEAADQAYMNMYCVIFDIKAIMEKRYEIGDPVKVDELLSSAKRFYDQYMRSDGAQTV